MFVQLTNDTVDLIGSCLTHVIISRIKHVQSRNVSLHTPLCDVRPSLHSITPLVMTKHLRQGDIPASPNLPMCLSGHRRDCTFSTAKEIQLLGRWKSDYKLHVQCHSHMCDNGAKMLLYTRSHPPSLHFQRFPPFFSPLTLWLPELPMHSRWWLQKFFASRYCYQGLQGRGITGEGVPSNCVKKRCSPGFCPKLYTKLTLGLRTILAPC
jgi:hypothetical protein